MLALVKYATVAALAVWTASWAGLTPSPSLVSTNGASHAHEAHAGSHAPDPFDHALRAHRYESRGVSLVNLTSLFAASESDPIVRALSRGPAGRTGSGLTRLHRRGRRVSPFYHRRRGSFTTDDVTLVFWTDADRLGRLVQLSEARRAPISIAYLLSPVPKLATQQLELLSKLLLSPSHPSLAECVDVHLVTSTEGHEAQHNAWRNVARAFARTEYVMFWDADLSACSDYQGALDRFRRDKRAARQGWVKAFEDGTAGLVVPVFAPASTSTTASSKGVEPGVLKSACTGSPSTLRSLYNDRKIEVHPSRQKELQSRGLDLPRYLSAGAKDYYALLHEDFEFGFEAYTIVKTNAGIWFDERFMGPAYQLAANTAFLMLSGMSLYILPHTWAMKLDSPAVSVYDYGESTAQPSEDAAARSTWLSFQRDLCHEIGTSLATSGLLHQLHPPGSALMTVCGDQDASTIQDEMDRLFMYSVTVEEDTTRRQDGLYRPDKPR